MLGTATHGLVDLQRRTQLFLNRERHDSLRPGGRNWCETQWPLLGIPCWTLRKGQNSRFPASKVGGTGCSMSEEFWQYSDLTTYTGTESIFEGIKKRFKIFPLIHTRFINGLANLLRAWRADSAFVPVKINTGLLKRKAAIVQNAGSPDPQSHPHAVPVKSCPAILYPNGP